MPIALTVGGNVRKAGDTMTGALNLPANGLVVGTSQLVVSGGKVGIGTASPSAQAHVHLDDAATSTVSLATLVSHNTSGTPAAGFGSALKFQLESTTTENRDAAQIKAEWVVATDASRRSIGRLTAFFTTSEVEGMAWGATAGGAPAIAFLGATPVARQTGGVATAGATYTANEQTMLQTAYNALRTYGLLT